MKKIGFFSKVEKVTWEKAAPSLEPLLTLRRESHVNLPGPAFCTSQVLPHHLKKAKDWDRGCVGSLRRFCLSAARHPSIMKGLSGTDSWGYMKLSPFTERPLVPHRLSAGPQGHLFFGPRKADFLGAWDVGQLTEQESGAQFNYFFLYLLSLTGRNDKDKG